VHFSKTSHSVTVNVKRIPKPRSDDERPKKLTKLEIVAEEPESERYDWITQVHCHHCGDIPSEVGNVIPSITLILAPGNHPRNPESPDNGSSIRYPSVLI
jgi:uncharacterized UBP type Zn finger protein